MSQLKPFVRGISRPLCTEYLVYNEPNDEWNIAQWDDVAQEWTSTVSDSLYHVTHYQELRRP